MSAPKIIGICGGSASGKTTLAESLQRYLGKEQCAIIGMDSYYKDCSGMDASQMSFDEPASFDLPLLIKDLQQLKMGQAVTVPCYNYCTHSRTTDSQPMLPTAFILLDGLFLFTLNALNALLDYRIYVDTPAATRLVRRINRDVKERGRSVTSVVVQYLNTVAPMHREHVLPNRELAGCVVSGSAPLDQALRHIAQSLGIKIG